MIDRDALAQIVCVFFLMKTVLLSLCLAAIAASASAKEFKLYAILLEETRVDLEDGHQAWSSPIYLFR